MAVKLGLLATAKYGFSAHLRTVEQDLKEKKAQTAGLARLQKWCGVRDRTEQEARVKMQEVLAKMADPPSSSHAQDWEEDWVKALWADGFLDDARCAESYTRVHFEHKRWGPLKIKAGLRARGISSAVAEKALRTVPEAEWQDAANELIRRRATELEANRDRVLRWLLQRGFTQSMVWTALDSLESDGES
jgi:SOS response regulatory protein OraA/RecX